MLKGTFPVEKFKQLSTPFYYYDVKLLQDRLDVVKTEPGKYGYQMCIRDSFYRLRTQFLPYVSPNTYGSVA